MEFLFENCYEITEKMYMDWATHPVGKLAKKRARAMLIMAVVEILLALGLAVVGLIRSEWMFVIGGLLFAVYFALNTFLFQRRKQLNSFRQMRRRQGTEHWDRVMRFGDKITVIDAGKETTFGWGRVILVSQNDSWIFLWLDPSSAYRVKRDAFTQGSAEKFVKFAADRVKAEKLQEVTE